MPDGQQNQPMTAEQQVSAEIYVDKAARWINGMFGNDWNSESGGGGAGGEYTFTDPAELQAIITQWEQIRDEVMVDGETIRQAIGFVRAPADDPMSTMQAEATVQSLLKLQDHNRAMFKYADGYVIKLKTALGQTISTDGSNAATFKREN